MYEIVFSRSWNNRLFLLFKWNVQKEDLMVITLIFGMEVHYKYSCLLLVH
jgi:hypothetical protein